MGHTKIHGANMGHTWVLSAPGGPHVGLMNLAIWVTVPLCSDMDMLFHIAGLLWGNPFVIIMNSRQNSLHANDPLCIDMEMFSALLALCVWVKSTSDQCHESPHKEPVSLSLRMKTWGTKWSVLTGTLKQMSVGVFLTCKKGKQNYQHGNIQHGNQHVNIQSV